MGWTRRSLYRARLCAPVYMAAPQMATLQIRFFRRLLPCGL